VTDPDSPPDQPPVTEAVEVAHTTAQMRSRHKDEASGTQQAVENLTAAVGSFGFVAGLGLAVTIWVTGNCLASAFGYHPIDPAPFSLLQTIVAVVSLMLLALVLITQRREDELADHRAQLILELSIANDRKTAKIIALLEESRRDNPVMADRVDDQAEAMSTPSNPEKVLEAIKVLRDDIL
jgi:uncharacterized membrane protein